jgi:lipopolysaccharide/colanic/teichoic acid biosynthesis glycosyltransferase/glycosyltransferase involved in cell wall biosynthesis
MSRTIKVLQVTAADVTVSKLLLPLIQRLAREGYEVHVACSDGGYVPGLREQGYHIHTIGIQRRINPVSNFKSLWRLYRLMKRERFHVVHVHTPVAAVLGRLAAWAARVPVVIYTAHGFYFHDGTASWARKSIIAIEKVLAGITDLVFTQSGEDAVTAVKEKICTTEKLLNIGNGVDVGCFTGDNASNGARAKLGLAKQDRVVGFVGRVVSEKGILELVEAMPRIIESVPDARLLIVGDTLDSDRDCQAKKAMAGLLASNGMASHVLFTGLVEDIPAVMSGIDVFVLPSHREGMPRTIIEAMASGKPVVATDIRGCREEVVQGSTGLLVPVKDTTALASAIISILSDSELARRMGQAGRKRALEFFDERLVLDKQVKAYANIIGKKLAAERLRRPKTVQRLAKRAADIIVSAACLALFALPFLLIAALIKLESTGPIFFRQERVGKDGQPFRVWKFRTMMDDAVNHGLGTTVANDDPRLTRVGKGLRNWGLDELPQLINVLAGEMSLIGPRPTLGYQVEQYTRFQRQRLLVKPGISSLAVVEGRNSLSWKERIRLDVWYVKHWSLWLDAKIVIKTFWSVLVMRKGIYGEGGINDDFLPQGLPTRGQD